MRPPFIAYNSHVASRGPPGNASVLDFAMGAPAGNRTRLISRTSPGTESNQGQNRPKAVGTRKRVRRRPADVRRPP